MTRRKLLSLIQVAGCAPAYAFGVEPNWLERTFYRVKLPCKSLTRSVRILHLSDFHASPVVPFSLIENAVSLGLDAKPDVICLTGDFVTDAAPFDEAQYGRILRRLSCAGPIFATLGNHDGGAWGASVGGLKDTGMVCALLSSAGIPLLHNRSEIVRLRDQSLRLAGVPDLWSEQVNGDLAFANIPADDPAILLAHNPDTKDVLADRPWDLMLSGHTHGGQVVLPILGDRFTPVRDKRFIAGLKPWNGRQVYVTRGVGSIDGVRVNCRPEVTILDLTS
ncbi:MAG TPA: phosphodiesterase YaeI [Bryobacteraceae bacterium]|nr:phosphodiesterase YaeI [Bryobacteraceae bacterium]